METRHGTKAGYRDAKCRCVECRAWNTAEAAKYRASFAARNGGVGYYAGRERKGRGPVVNRRLPGQCSECGVGLAQSYAEVPLCQSCRYRSKRAVWIAPAVRLAIYERDAWTCGICSEPVESGLANSDPWQATLDHVTPRSLGGGDEPENLRLTHRWCNVIRSNKAGLTLADL